MKRRRGLYRFTSHERLELARTHALAGDASPFLDRETYEALGFEPHYDALPTREHYLGTDRTSRYALRPCDLTWHEVQIPPGA
jgi:hypothetical protein